jgi:hypothetical protein
LAIRRLVRLGAAFGKPVVDRNQSGERNLTARQNIGFVPGSIDDSGHSRYAVPKAAYSLDV